MSRLAITKAVLTRAIMGDPKGKTAWERLTEKEPERIDKDFPLNIRLLARVNLDIIEFQIAEKFLSMPKPAAKGTVVEVGVITHGNDLVDYLARISPDNAIEESMMPMLLVETQAGKVLSTKLFMQAAEIIPNTVEEIDAWLNEDTGILGAEILTDPEDREFFRSWGEGERVKPMVAREKVFTDRYGETTTTNKLVQMMFGREVTNATGEKLTEEYTLASYVNEQSVEILVGIPITIKEGDIIGA